MALRELIAVAPMYVYGAIYAYGALWVIAARYLIALLTGRPLAARRRPQPPPAWTDETLGEHKFATANGIKFHYVAKGER